MRVLTRISHDDHDLGAVYELEGELLDRFLAAGVVVPAAEWTYTYRSEAGVTGDQQHIFARVAPRVVTEVAPAASTPSGESLTTQEPAAPVVPGAPEAPLTRAGADPEE